MISKLPRWAWVGAWVLAFVAGIINVVGLAGFQHQVVTHLTGTTSNLAGAIANANVWEFLHFGSIIFSFIAGCMGSGLILRDASLKFGAGHAAAFLLEAISLCLAVPLLQHGHFSGICLSAFACGLQNALASAYSGAVVRTTHVSGMFTDFGIFLGQGLRGAPVDRARLTLCIIVISGFLSGGIAGSIAFRSLENATLYIPAAIVGTIALSYAGRRLQQMFIKK